MKFTPMKNHSMFQKTFMSLAIAATCSLVLLSFGTVAQAQNAPGLNPALSTTPANTSAPIQPIGNVGNGGNTAARTTTPGNVNAGAPSVAGIQYQQPSPIVSANVRLQGVNPTTTAGGLPPMPTGSGVITPTGQVVPATAPSAPMSLPGTSYNPAIQGGDSQTARLVELMNSDPATIRKVLRDIESRNRASKEITNAKGVQTSVNAPITPGSNTPVIRTFANRTSSIVVVDQFGQPWPIENFTLGAADDFNVHRLDKNAKDKGYMLDITPTENYVAGNLTLKLEGLNVPVVVEIISGQPEYDAPLTLRVMGKGPNTTYSSVSAPAQTDNVLYSILQGVAPSDLKPLKVENGLAQAWLSKDGQTMYVRSNLKIMTFEHMTASPDGTYAYRTSPMPVLSYKYENKFGQISIDGF